MPKLKQFLPLSIAIFFGWLTLIGLLIPVPQLSQLVLGWAGLLVAFALLLGVLNLLIVHLNRIVKNGVINIYSLVLVLSMVAVFVIAFLDTRDPANDYLNQYFIWVQAPLEAALASLLAFFLLFAGFRLMKRQQTVWSYLFLLTAVLLLVADVLLVTNWLPACGPETLCAANIVIALEDVIRNIIVTAGMRGLILGVALGTITLAVRLLIGMERPYNK